MTFKDAFTSYIKSVNWAIVLIFVIFFNFAMAVDYIDNPDQYTVYSFIKLNGALFLMTILSWIFSYNTSTSKNREYTYRPMALEKDIVWTICRSRTDGCRLPDEPLSRRDIEDVCEILNEREENQNLLN